MAGIIIMIIALVGGYFFIKRFSSIERYFFGSDDANADEAGSGVTFLMVATAIGALATAWGIIANIFDLSYSKEGITYTGVSLVVLVIFGSMAHAAFHSNSVGRMIGKMAFMALSCLLGALVGAAGSVIVFGILVIVMFIYIFGAALSGNSSSSSRSSYSSSNNTDNNSDEVEINVEGEMFNRKAHDIGFGKLRDDHGDTWSRNFDGSLERDN